MGLIESLPVTRVRPVLFLPLWLGTLRDVSGNGNHATNTLCHWTGGQTDAVRFPATDRLTIAASPELDIIKGTLFVSGRNFHRQTTADRIISKTDGGGTSYEFRMTTQTTILLNDGAVSRTLAINPDIETRSVAVTFVSGEVPNGYKDGSLVGAFNGVTNVAVNDAAITIGNFSSGTVPTGWDFDVVAIYDEPLTATEISDLHDWSQSRFTPRKQWPGGGLDIPTLSGTALEPRFLDNIQSARVTLADQTSGTLSNTNYTIESGTWKVAEDATTGERYIECVVAGIISRRNVEAYGTWELDIQKADASDTYTLFIASEIGSDGSGSQDGYMLRLLSNERVGLRENAAGVGSYLFFTDTNEITPAVRYMYRVTRSAAGIFTTYNKSPNGPWSIVGNVASGSNPATDTTTTTSLYCLHDFDAGDRLYADRQFAGVVT